MNKQAMIIATAIIFVVSFGVYANTLSNGFVWDDTKVILENRWIKDVRHLPDIFSHDIWGFWQERGSSEYYRPFIHVMLMGAYHIAGLTSWVYHLLNILFHAGTSVLVFFLAMRIYRDSGQSTSLHVPFVAAILFATHPVHTEAVAWATGIVEVSFTFFFILSFYLYVWSSEQQRLKRRHYFLSVIAFIAALLSKEPSLTLPLLLLAYDYAFRRKELRRKVILYIPYLIVSCFYLLTRIIVLGAVAVSGSKRSIGEGLADVFRLFGLYQEKLLLPIKLNAYYLASSVGSFSDPEILTGMAATVLFIVVLVIALRRSKVVFLNLMFIITPLLPALYITAVRGIPFAERYLYLPSIGFVILLSFGLFRLVDHLRLNPRIFVSVGILIALIFSALTIGRNRVWKDDFTLWSETVQESPDSNIVHNNLGRAYFTRGDVDKAIEHYRIALRLDPEHAEAHNNLGAALASKNLFDEAEQQFLMALKLRPGYSDAHNNIGILYGTRGYPDKAIAHFKDAIKSRPDFADAHHNLGVTYLNKGMTDLAIQEFREALRLNPDAINTHINLARAYEMMGLTDMASRHREIARRRSQTDR